MATENGLQQGILDWFQEEGFQHLVFSGPTERISTNTAETILYKLHKRAGHDTFYKEATGGALIVFEVSMVNGAVRYEGYCPLLLFGIWERKLNFKADAGPFTSYRNEGFVVEQRLRRCLKDLQA